MATLPEDDGILFEPKDIPLKDDVRVLGAILGDVLRHQGDPGLFDRVEEARRAARREQSHDHPNATARPGETSDGGGPTPGDDGPGAPRAPR